MKNILKINLMLGMALSLFLVNCNKSTGPNDLPKLPDLTAAPIPLFTVDASSDVTIKGGFEGKFSLDLYFPNDTKSVPSSCDIVVAMNKDYSNIKTLKGGITGFPSSVDFSVSDLATLFGVDTATIIAPGSVYEIRASFTMPDGTEIPGFVDLNNGTTSSVSSSNINSFPGAQTSLTFKAPCKYDASIFDGNFAVINDEWADYGAGDIVPVTKINDYQFSFKYAAADAQPIIVTVDTTDNTVSVTKQYYGNYGAAYGDFYVEALPGDATNFVDPCDGTISVALDQSSSTLGDFGAYRITMRKQ